MPKGKDCVVIYVKRDTKGGPPPPRSQFRVAQCVPGEVVPTPPYTPVSTVS